MTRSGVERTERTASRPAHVRIGLRVLAIGGLAGAAWLLSGVAAHAAEAALPAEDATTDLSVVSLVDGTGQSTVVTPVTDTLDAVLVTTDLVNVGRASTVVLPSVTAASSVPVTTQPATRPDGDRDSTTRGATGTPAATPDRAGASDGGLLGAVRGLATPLGALAGPTGLLNPLTRAVDPVVAPLDRVLRPVTGVLLTAATPVTSALSSVTRATLGGELVGQRAYDLIPGARAVPGAGAGPVRMVPAAALGARTVGLTEASTGFLSGDRRYAGTELRPADAPDERQGSGNLPDRHYPAPIRAYLGAGAGVPAGGPGSHSEGGGFAVVPSSVVESTVAFHRLPVTTDVEVPRREAEAPTVSPD